MTTLPALVKSIRDRMRQDTGTGSDELRIRQLGWMLFFKIFCDKEKEQKLLYDDYVSPVPPALDWDSWAADDEGITGDALQSFIDKKLFPALKNIDVNGGGSRALLLREVFANNFNYMKSGTHLRQVINLLNKIDFNSSKDKQVFGGIYESFLGELQSAGTLGEYYTPRAITKLLTTLTNPRHGEKVLDPACGTGGFLTDVIEHLKQTVKTPQQNEEIGQNVRGWEFQPLPYLLANTNLILHDVSHPSIRYGDSLARPLADYTQKDRADVILANPPFGGIVSNNNDSNFPQNFRTKESADLFLILMIHLLKVGGRAAIVLPDGSLTGDGVKQRIRRHLLETCNLHTIIRLPNSVFQPYASVATNLLLFTKVGATKDGAAKGVATKKIWYWQHKLPEGVKAYSKTKPIRFDEFKTLKTWVKNPKTTAQSWCVSMQTIAENGYNLDIKNPHKPQEEKPLNSTQLLNALHISFKKGDNLLNRLGVELGKGYIVKRKK